MISSYVALPDGRRACLVCIDTFWKSEGAFMVELANDECETGSVVGTWRIGSSDEGPTALSLEADTDLDDPADADVVNELLGNLLHEHGAAWGFGATEEFS
jgi:hypothetical protein